MEQPVKPPSLPIGEASEPENRLWIGNLDQRLTEYQLLKILQPFGTIEKFDLLFHRSGPLDGQPRGYAFVTYEDRLCAVRAMEKLNGVQLGSKQVSVKWAHSISNDEKIKPTIIPDIPALAGAKKEEISNKVAAIHAIEAKLKLMENSTSSDFEFSGTPSLALPSSAVIAARKEQPRPPHRNQHRGNKRFLPYTRQKR